MKLNKKLKKLNKIKREQFKLNNAIEQIQEQYFHDIFYKIIIKFCMFKY